MKSGMVGLDDSTHPTGNVTEDWGMSNYRRYYVPGGTYFFTLVTHERRPLFQHETARRCFS